MASVRASDPPEGVLTLREFSGAPLPEHLIYHRKGSIDNRQVLWGLESSTRRKLLSLILRLS